MIVEAEVDDGGTLSYQWYSNTANNNTGGTEISGATSKSYTPPTGTEGITYYYVVVTNTNADAPGLKTAKTTSNAAEVMVSSSLHQGNGSESFDLATSVSLPYMYPTLTIPAGYTSVTNSSSTIPEAAWYNNNFPNLASVTIGNDVKSIGSRAFYNCTKLISVTIENSVKTIESRAFYGCNKLESLTIGNSVTSIGSVAFNGCTSLISVTIPAGVTNFEPDAFNGCTKLIEIAVDADSNKYISDDGIVYNLEKTTLVRYPQGKPAGSFTIPDYVTSIGSYAFYGCTSLTGDIPAGITNIDSYAFYNCTGLTNVNIPAGVASVSSNAFYGCNGLISVNIPVGVTSIGSFAFSGCNKLTEVTIPGVTSIGSSAFSSCSKLESVTIPSVTSIGSSAFASSSLTSVSIPASVTSFEPSAFNSCTKLAEINVDAANNKYSSDDGIMYNIEKTTLIRHPQGKSADSFIIPAGVTSIGSYAFYGCTSLASIPNSVTSIGSYAFYGCTGLTSLTIPDGVTSISSNGFYNCTGLTSVAIPNKRKMTHFTQLQG